LFVIIKSGWPPKHLNAPSTSRNDVVLQGAEEFGVSNIEDQVNDPMEEDDNNNNIVEDDGTNELIQDLFARPDEDDDEDIGDLDVPLLEKAEKPLYEGSKENLLSATLLLVNLKVLNGLSNSCMTQILRYVIWFIITYT
jgi:hypothetical protein